MSTITPNGDQTRTVNYTAFAVGDAVIQLAGAQLAGRVAALNAGGIPTQITVDWVDGSSGDVAVTAVRRL